MLVRFKKADKRTAAQGVTLTEVLVAFWIFGLMVSGLIYGYTQINRIAEWSSMSLAAQSIASEGVEQNFCKTFPSTSSGSTGQLQPTNYYASDPTNYVLDVPANGVQYQVTNIVTITQVQTNPPLMQIRVDCVWEFFAGETGTNRVFYTNTLVTLRATDQ